MLQVGSFLFLGQLGVFLSSDPVVLIAAFRCGESNCMLFELRATFLHVKSMGASQLDCCKLVLGWFQFGDSNPSRDELNRFLVVAYGFYCS